jgi:hypothetical protein
MLEKVLQESLDLSRLSDALKLLGEGITIPQANAPAVPAEAKEKPVKPIEPVTEGDLSEVDAASIEV